MPSRNPVLIALVQKQTDAFNKDCTLATIDTRVAISKEIEHEFKKERERK